MPDMLQKMSLPSAMRRTRMASRRRPEADANSSAVLSRPPSTHKRSMHSVDCLASRTPCQLITSLMCNHPEQRGFLSTRSTPNL